MEAGAKVGPNVVIGAGCHIKKVPPIANSGCPCKGFNHIPEHNCGLEQLHFQQHHILGLQAGQLGQDRRPFGHSREREGEGRSEDFEGHDNVTEGSFEQHRSGNHSDVIRIELRKARL